MLVSAFFDTFLSRAVSLDLCLESPLNACR